MVIVSVPGKVHLMGEHAVVYGKPALLSAINLRLSVMIEPAKKGVAIKSSEPEDYIRYALEIVKKEFSLTTLPPMVIAVDSQIPAGYHLGSSAATAVGVVAALVYFLKKIWNPERINQIAYEVEKKQHGNPSGGDNTAVTMGGFLWYRRELEFLKSMWQLPVKLPGRLNNFYLLDTGRPKETTGEMVSFVKLKFNKPASPAGREKSKTENLFNENEKQTRRIAVAIKENNQEELLDALKRGERTLEGMGVVSKNAVIAIRAVEQIGGAAKILGGGGRSGGVGFLLCYHPEFAKLNQVAEKLNYPLQRISLGEEGLRLEER